MIPQPLESFRVAPGPFHIMRGTNFECAPHAVPVHWMNYFDGSEAGYGHLLAAYGFLQIFGSVKVLFRL